MWNLFFTVIPIVQYALLNASIVTYNNRRKQINDMIAEMNALDSKRLKKFTFNFIESKETNSANGKL
jgi:hypothetical protein